MRGRKGERGEMWRRERIMGGVWGVLGGGRMREERLEKEEK